MKEQFKIIAGIDSQSGELGLAFEDLPTIDHDFSMGNGRLLAHDLLEHQNGLESIGGIGEELQALGGVWFVRGQHDDIVRTPNNNAAYQHLSSDVMRMAYDFANGEDFGCVYAYAFEDDDEFENDYRDILRHAVKSFRLEYNDEFTREQKTRLKEYWHSVKRFMRQGMSKAQERYKDKSMRANTMFWLIAEAIDSLHPESEGQQYTLSLNWGTMTAHAEEYYQEQCVKCLYDIEGDNVKHTDQGTYCKECHGGVFAKCKECDEEFELETAENKTHCNYCQEEEVTA